MITKEDKEILVESINAQVKQLRENLKDKNNFIEKTDWKELSIVKEGEPDGDS